LRSKNKASPKNKEDNAMASDTGIKKLVGDLDFVKQLCQNLIAILPEFDITDEKILPYGLKPHTRSVSWIVEQVIVQQMKFNGQRLGLSDVDFKLPDTGLHDCVARTPNENYHINVKISNTGSKKRNKNDVAAVKKLFERYVQDPTYNLIYACFGIRFNNIHISFEPNYLKVFSPQFLDIYVNPTNDKIQAFYDHEPNYRTREEFLQLLRKNSRIIKL
jgi:hypothetical protein